MDTLADKKLINRKGKIFKAKDLLRSMKLIVYVFCDEKCEKINTLLKSLKAIYEESIRRSYKLEIIFVTLDTNEEEMMTHFKTKHGNWYAIPFGDLVIGELIYKYGITNKPTVVVVKNDGRIVTNQAYQEILENGLNVLVTWSD